MKLRYVVTMPQWTHADLPPGQQAALICAKMRMQYGGVLPPDPPDIALYTGDVYVPVDFGDGRWAAKQIVCAGPDRTLGEVFCAPHGSEHISLPELSTQNIRVECGVVKAEGRLDGHDDEIKELRKTVQRLELELAAVRGRLPVAGITRRTAELRTEDDATIRARGLEL